MNEPNDRTERRHPNDPEVVAHDLKMAAVTMTDDERNQVLAGIDRQLRAIEESQPADE